jgi:hypothetical protein
VLDEAFGQRVELTFIRRQPSDVVAQLVREPADGTPESTRQAFLISRRVGCPS